MFVIHAAPLFKVYKAPSLSVLFMPVLQMFSLNVPIIPRATMTDEYFSLNKLEAPLRLSWNWACMCESLC